MSRDLGQSHSSPNDSVDKFTSRYDATLPVGEDGDNSSALGEENEPEQEPQLGTDERQTAPNYLEDEKPLNIEEIVRRHNVMTRWRRPETVQGYECTFRNLATKSGLSSLNRRLLASKGHDLIVDYVLGLPEGSRRFAVCHIKSYWLYGLNMPWPIDNRRDFGRFRKIGKRLTPRDDSVRPWVRPLEVEPDAYVKSMVLCVAQFGWRPSHIWNICWDDLKFDASGRPFAVIADGVKRRFKTSSWIVAWLPPDVQQALEKWHGECPDTSPDKPIWAYRHVNGKVDPTRRLSEHQFRKQWAIFCKRWGLEKTSRLTPCQFRHFVSTKCREAGLNGPPKAAMCGHEQNAEVFTDKYDNPEIDDLLDDQRAKLPHGTLGLLKNIEVETINGVPAELLALWQEYQSGKVTSVDCAGRLEELKNRLQEEQVKTIEA